MRQDDDYRRGRHVVSALNVQLVFVIKYRRGVLTGEHLGTLREVFASVCADFGAKLVGMDGEDDHLPLGRRLPAAGRGRPAGELPQGRLGLAAAPALPGAHPPGAPVVPVVFLGLGWWRTVGDPQGVHPPAAHSWPAGLTPPGTAGLAPGRSRSTARTGRCARACSGAWARGRTAAAGSPPMEEPSLDIRRYVLGKLGEDRDRSCRARWAGQGAAPLAGWAFVGRGGRRAGGAGERRRLDAGQVGGPGAGTGAVRARARPGRLPRPRPHHPPLLPHPRLRAPGRPGLPGLGGAGVGGGGAAGGDHRRPRPVPAPARPSRPAPTGPAWRPAASPTSGWTPTR